MTSSQRVYEACPRKDKRGVNLISDVLPFGRAVVWRGKRNQQCSMLRKSTAAHMMLSFACSMKEAT
jgi:hypothetical protein